MSFQALTGAPSLREGVLLNIMAIPQSSDCPPKKLAIGARVTLRFGHCCPMVREGCIVAADADSAVLAFEGAEWTLVPRTTGISVAGIVSQDWVVVRRAGCGGPMRAPQA